MLHGRGWAAATQTGAARARSVVARRKQPPDVSDLAASRYHMGTAREIVLCRSAGTRPADTRVLKKERTYVATVYISQHWIVPDGHLFAPPTRRHVPASPSRANICRSGTTGGHFVQTGGPWARFFRSTRVSAGCLPAPFREDLRDVVPVWHLFAAKSRPCGTCLHHAGTNRAHAASACDTQTRIAPMHHLFEARSHQSRPRAASVCKSAHADRTHVASVCGAQAPIAPMRHLFAAGTRGSRLGGVSSRLERADRVHATSVRGRRYAEPRGTCEVRAGLRTSSFFLLPTGPRCRRPAGSGPPQGCRCGSGARR